MADASTAVYKAVYKVVKTSPESRKTPASAERLHLTPGRTDRVFCFESTFMFTCACVHVKTCTHTQENIHVSVCQSWLMLHTEIHGQVIIPQKVVLKAQGA